MNSYVFVDSVQRSSGVSNSYVYPLTRIYKGVHRAELLSAAFPRQTSCTHVILNINEFQSPTNSGNFAIINNFAVTPQSNIAFTKESFYEQCTDFDTPFDIDRLTVSWKDLTGNTISISDNSLVLKLAHLK